MLYKNIGCLLIVVPFCDFLKYIHNNILNSVFTHTSFVYQMYLSNIFDEEKTNDYFLGFQNYTRDVLRLEGVNLF